MSKSNSFVSKFKITRVFIKDSNGNYYRIFSFSNPKDRKGEYYLKLMFPDIKGFPLKTATNTDEGAIKEIDILKSGVQEFSYHYRSGVSHFKDGVGYVDSKHNSPSLFDFPALHLVRFVLRDISGFEKHRPTKILKEDYLLPTEFSGKPRGFELSVTRVLKWNVINETGETTESHKIALEDQNVSLHVNDAIWTREPLAGTALFELFRYDDPTSSFEYKKNQG